MRGQTVQKDVIRKAEQDLDCVERCWREALSYLEIGELDAAVREVEQASFHIAEWQVEIGASGLSAEAVEMGRHRALQLGSLLQELVQRCEKGKDQVRRELRDMQAGSQALKAYGFQKARRTSYNRLS